MSVSLTLFTLTLYFLSKPMQNKSDVGSNKMQTPWRCIIDTGVNGDVSQLTTYVRITETHFNSTCKQSLCVLYMFVYVSVGVFTLHPPHSRPDRDSYLSVSKVPLIPPTYSYTQPCKNSSVSTFDEG